MSTTALPSVSAPPLPRATAQPAAPALDLVQWVSTLQGTDSFPEFSTGNTLPLVARPHGMVAWSPQTATGRWFFDRRAVKIHGFRATHQPSPWIADYGQFLVMPSSGARAPAGIADTESFYKIDRAIARPHHFRARLERHGIVAEMTPTERGASLRFNYQEGDHAWLSFQLGQGTELHVDAVRGLVTGVSTANQGGVPAGFGCHFVAEIGTEIEDSGTYVTPIDSPEVTGQTIGVWLRLRRPASRAVTVKIATSFISPEQALLNLRRELGEDTFETSLAAARAAWNQRLGVITVDGATPDQLRTFYSCLYRTFLFPRMWHEFDASGARVHFSPYDGRVHPGPLYTDCGFWDVYRTLLPLLTLTAPDLLGDMIEGWVNAYKEGGWLPNWASPGYRECMVGSHSAAVIVDAWSKGIRNFDVAAAYAAMRKDATTEPPVAAYGRRGIDLYSKLGYVPHEIDHAVARTTDYANCDFAIARLARALDHEADAALLAPRALNYRNLFDPSTRFLRARLADGSWREPFREFEWASEYIEGGAWQHSWSVTHDAAGLVKLLGGAEATVARLDQLLAQPPRFESGAYPREIHEMTEMAAADFGQYAHSNQPVHHILYFYTFAGRPDRTQHWVRRVMDELYSPTAFAGDEDNGEMSAWYVLNALGVFPFTVGLPAYVLGAPRFPRVTLHLAEGRAWTVEAVGDAQSQPYVRSVEVNGVEHRDLAIDHAVIAAGGHLRFHLTADPALAAARGSHLAPYSLSTHG